MTVSWNEKLILISKDDLEHIGGNIYMLDINKFKADISDLMDDSDGIVNDTIYLNNPPFELDGVTYARGLKIINDYKIEFEDGNYAVNLIGANSNIASVSVVNQVSVRPFNSAGLQIVPVGSGLSKDEHDRLFSTVEKTDTISVDESKIAESVWKYKQGGWEIDSENKQMVMLNNDGTELQRFDCFDESGNPNVDRVRKMIPAT